MKYAVTGGAGFIGSNIVKILKAKGHEVCIIDNYSNNSNHESSIRVDIRDKETMEKILCGCDGIFHEAALTSVQESFLDQNRYYDVNVNGTKTIFDIAISEGIRVIFASSSSIYGNPDKIPITESNNRNPINPYGLTKLNCEQLATTYAKLGLEVIGLRYFNVYGMGQTGTYAGVITKFLMAIQNQTPLVINGDGKQSRDFIHVHDVAEANFTIMKKTNVKSGFFNIGTQTTTSILSLAKNMIEISKHGKGIQHIKPLTGDVNISIADMSQTKKIFNWEHRINLSTGLNKLIQEHQNNHKTNKLEQSNPLNNSCK